MAIVGGKGVEPGMRGRGAGAGGLGGRAEGVRGRGRRWEGSSANAVSRNWWRS